MGEFFWKVLFPTIVVALLWIGIGAYIKIKPSSLLAKFFRGED